LPGRLGSSPVLFAFTMSLAPPVHPSPILLTDTENRVLLCFIDPRVRKISNEASSCPGIFSRTLRFYYVASSPGSPLTHLLDGHRKLVGRSAIPARSCPGPVRYHWGSIVELEVPPDETPGLMTLQPHNTDMLQSITYAKSPYPPDRSNSGQKN